MDKPKTVGILGTQDKDKHNTTQKTKEMSNLNPTTNQNNGSIRHTQYITKTNITQHRKLTR